MLSLLVGPQIILDTPQVITVDWENLGPVLDCRAMNMIALWLKVDINDSQDVRIRARMKHDAISSDYYFLPIRATYPTVVRINPEYKELDTDADQNVVLSWTLDHMVPFIQFQVQAGHIGPIAAQIEEARITAGY